MEPDGEAEGKAGADGEGKTLAALLKTAETKLRAAIKTSGAAITAAQTSLSEQSAEKKAQLACYRGVALIAEGVLTPGKRAGSFRTVVPHLGVAGSKANAPKAVEAGSQATTPRRRRDGGSTSWSCPSCPASAKRSC